MKHHIIDQQAGFWRGLVLSNGAEEVNMRSKGIHYCSSTLTILISTALMLLANRGTFSGQPRFTLYYQSSHSIMGLPNADLRGDASIDVTMS